MRPQVTFVPQPARPARGRLAVYAAAPERLEAAALSVFAVPGDEGWIDVAIPVDGVVTASTCPARLVPLERALWPLLALRPGPGTDDSAALWATAARFAVRVVHAGLLVPGLHGGSTEGVTAVWHAVHSDPGVAEGVGRLAAAMPAAATALQVGDGSAGDDRQVRVWAPGDLVAALLDAVADLLPRRTLEGRPGPPRDRLLPWTARWAEGLVDAEDPRVPLRADADDLVAEVGGWGSVGAVEADVVLTLTAPDDVDGVWELEFGVLTDAGHVDAAAAWEHGGSVAEALLAGLARAARVFPPLHPVLKEAAPERAVLGLDEAWQLIADAAPVLAGAGVRLELPGSLSDEGLRAKVGVHQAEDADHAVLEWSVMLGATDLDDTEVSALSGISSPLALVAGSWVALDDDARSALALAGRRAEVSRAEALALSLAGEVDASWFPDAPASVVVDTSGPLADLVERIRETTTGRPALATPPGFVGTLRPYQQRGVAWLGAMRELGLGAVLADAMGLGKTPQLIAHLLAGPTEGARFLVVCPTSVVGNWERELQRFAPGLVVHRHHGPGRMSVMSDVEGVVITSYGTMRRDVELLSGVAWDVVALDEAQQVKNPATAGAKAARRLKAGQVVALTGTPLENRLAELWAILDATNRGLLSSRAAFVRRFVGPIEQRRDEAAAQRLRRLVSPFVLRRTKDDPSVAPDLPDKIERTLICELTAEQATLYADVVNRSLADLKGLAGITRRGRVLALLTALKQIVNHPAQYTKEPNPPLDNRSGKLAALREIVVAATEAGDKVLVFTQYVAMGRLLVEVLGRDLGRPVGFLHGGLSAPARDRLVDEFAGDELAPVLVVSTRAGGLGLNLVAANHVVHYDRWWNPAVEDQATDRAHRIGQTRTVEVHKLVTEGTVEERIGELLERKREIADAVVGAGEQWITELDDRALAELVALAGDAHVTDYREDM